MMTGVPIIDLLLLGVIVGASVCVACVIVAALAWALVWLVRHG